MSGYLYSVFSFSGNPPYCPLKAVELTPYRRQERESVSRQFFREEKGMADEQTLDTQNFEAQAAEAVAPADDLAARVQTLEEQLAAAQDQSLRMAADLQNVRRRAEQDVEKAHKFALEKFAGDLLPVIDSLERGLELSSPDDVSIKAVREGMQLTLKLFHDTLARYNLEAIDPHGAPFNPEHHQAMAMEESIHAEPNSVLKVFQKGYLLNGRLLRPAMVVVSKATTTPPPSIDEQA
ncbi:nucleotide exchange factor GrpE [Ectopseudomonas oleovorans]|uniref:Protein GrpE n=4 Tax=Ectopseudomonas oleovorans TaxID=301 RepID=A0AA42GER0_ECTOL|nr:nucleotide exchange factor GrpE [Pseudomonas oleovorans]MCR1826667.1 nucleotide exchange factor GrpE [Pseudomonas oleovorans]MDG9978204.1 nucleotide exchange factor GrpE [Pseudomonas oleovorans]MDH0567206.1 nucleotide exchange factor GrpE [Pseudomonas oleovorans]MDH1338324.1 nucleotide exchange factor GrpE [Pseudomonas oleovorans]MDH1491484.1 nucleotide exchange factor GrpE [Pseudomonas oleovorans]